MARGNRLLNRVKRHAETTTLFRQRDTVVSVLSPATRQPMPQAAVHAGLENLPMGEVIGLPPLTAVPHTPTPPANLADTLITRPQPSPPTPPKTTGQPTAPLARQPYPPTAPSATAPDDNDPTWRRLSAIMRKHEEKQAAEEAAETAVAERGETYPAADKTPPDVSRQPKKEANIAAGGDSPGVMDGKSGIDRHTAANKKTAASHSQKVVSQREVGDPPPISRLAEPVGTRSRERKAQETGSPPPGSIEFAGPTEGVQRDALVDRLIPDRAQVTAVASKKVPPAASKTDAGADNAGADNAGADVTMVGDPAAGSPIQAKKDAKAGEPTHEAATAVHPVALPSVDKTTPPFVAAAETTPESPAETIETSAGNAPVSHRPASDLATETPISTHLEETKTISGWPGSGGQTTGQNRPQSVPEIRSSSKADEMDATQPPASDLPRSSSVIQTKADDAPSPARPPLEAAWPVERREAAASAPPPPLIVEPILPRHTPENAQVASALQAVAAERPSGSSVEVIPPRRPRPANAPTLIQRAPEKKAPPRQPPKPQPQQSAADVETVPTAIGPLPADLWRLIGDDLPMVMRAAVPETQTEPERLMAAQRSSAPPETSAPERPQTQPAAIQATAATAQAPTTTETTGSSPEAEAESETSAETAEPDVDELARRVYSEIKRKLSVEWERMRGKKW